MHKPFILVMASLWFGDIQPFSCEVHPVVPLSILHHFPRRTHQTQSAIGILLGSSTAGVIRLEQAIPLPWSKTKQGAYIMTDKKYSKLIDLIKQAHPNYNAIGMYCTGKVENRTHAAIFNNVLKAKFPNLTVILNLDFDQEGMRMTAYRQNVPGLQTMVLFEPIRTTVLQDPLNKLALRKTDVRELIKGCKEYVQRVIKGEEQGDDAVLALLSRASSVLRESGEFEGEDIALVSLLSELTLTQAELSDKIHAVL